MGRSKPQDLGRGLEHDITDQEPGGKGDLTNQTVLRASKSFGELGQKVRWV